METTRGRHHPRGRGGAHRRPGGVPPSTRGSDGHRATWSSPTTGPGTGTSSGTYRGPGRRPVRPGGALQRRVPWRRREASVLIDGEQAGTIGLWGTGGTDNWCWDRTSVTLDEGRHTIRLYPNGELPHRPPQRDPDPVKLLVTDVAAFSSEGTASVPRTGVQGSGLEVDASIAGWGPSSGRGAPSIRRPS